MIIVADHRSQWNTNTITHTKTHKHTYMHAKTHTLRHANAHTHTRTNTHKYRHARSHTHKHKLKRLYSHTHTNILTHPHTHPNTHTRALVCLCVEKIKLYTVYSAALKWSNACQRSAVHWGITLARIRTNSVSI